MEQLGYSTDGILTAAFRQQPVWDLTSTNGVGGAADDECDTGPQTIRMRQLREQEQVEATEGVGGFGPDDMGFRAAPTTLLDPTKGQRAAVQEILDYATEDAKASGLSESEAAELSRILHSYVDVFRLEFGCDPPVEVPPMKVRVKPGRYL
jgi:AraC-like DNA-binding protein